MTTASTFRPQDLKPVQLVQSDAHTVSSEHIAPEHRPTSIIREPLSLTVNGTLPRYLTNAALYRIGPGIVDVKHSDGVQYKTRHYFDMPGFLHEYRIQSDSNTVTYRNVCLAESKVRAIENTSSSRFKEITFGKKDPCRSLFGKFSQLLVPSPIDPLTEKTADPNISVTVEELPGKGLVALTDASHLVKVDENILAADHFFKYEDIVPDAKGHFSSAHGHYDTHSGEYINFTYKFGGARVPYHVFSVSKEGKSRLIASFEETPRYIHSFAVTDSYVIMILWPAKMHPLKILFHQNFMAGLEYAEDEPTIFYVISRSENRVVAKYRSESFFCFHQLNAYEEKDSIVIDLSWWSNVDLLEKATADVMFGEPTFLDNAPARIVLSGLQDAVFSYPQESTSVSLDKLSDRALEMPCVNPKFLRKDYTYAYGLTEPSAESENMYEVIKLDVKTGKNWVWGRKDTVACEPLFVPDPLGVNEDDGCLLTILSNKNEDEASMVVLNARNMTEIARATVPILMPGGFHGKVTSV
ncbi:Carotenoid oxygenase [Gracilaria domingensis]|nr:Carotenoid oxygenase [Gracilaria domingensis]